MSKNYPDKTAAVSPVVGVMLMLVVTIIIAAVVSAFSGGLSQTTSKAPQITISAEVHDGSSIILDHNGGNSISGGTLVIRTFVPSGMFKDMNHEVDLTKIIYLPKNTADITYETIQAGDKIKIKWEDAFAESSYGGYMAPGVGEPLNIEVFDSSTGKAIAIVQTTVLP